METKLIKWLFFRCEHFFLISWNLRRKILSFLSCQIETAVPVLSARIHGRIAVSVQTTVTPKKRLGILSSWPQPQLLIVTCTYSIRFWIYTAWNSVRGKTKTTTETARTNTHTYTHTFFYNFSLVLRLITHSIAFACFSKKSSRCWRLMYINSPI